METKINNSFYAPKELSKMGFKYLGDNVQISRFARFYTPGKIIIGNNIRIDDFSILSGNIHLGSHIHISAHCLLYGSNGIIMEDYTGLSPRATIFSASDDFSGLFMIGPVIPNKFRNVKCGTVIIKKFCQIGAGSVIMPALTIAEGAVVGAMSLVNKNLEAWQIYAGIPARRIKERDKRILELVKKFEKNQKSND